MEIKKFTLKEKKAYFNKRARKGSKDKNGKPLSDFVRGVYKEKADEIHRKQVSYARMMNNDWLNKTNQTIDYENENSKAYLNLVSRINSKKN